MLTAIKLQNFRCFRDATLRLGPLTALVGPNASGKSSLLEVAAGRKPGPDDVWRRRQGTGGEVRWQYDAEPEVASRRFGLKADRRRQLGAPGPKHKGLLLGLKIDSLRQHQPTREVHELAPDGSNLVSVIDSLPRRTQGELSKRFCELIPVLDDLDVRPSSPGQQRIVFHDRWADVWYEPQHVSDGTLFALALLTLQYQQSRPSLVAIEDPEHGLHPYLLGNVVRVLRDLSSETQIVMATQSPDLLEHLEPGEVRFLSRNPDDGSVAIEEPETETDDWRRAYEEHQKSLGSIWLSGGAGGVPAE